MRDEVAVKEGVERWGVGGRRCEVAACVKANVCTVILVPSIVHSRTLSIGQDTDCESSFSSHKAVTEGT